MESSAAPRKRPSRGGRLPALLAGGSTLLAAGLAWFVSRERARASDRRWTALERTARTARAGESRVTAVLEAAPDAMLTVTADGRIAMVNTQAERLFGYSREELIGQPVETLLPARLRDLHAEYRRHYHVQPHARPMGPGLDLVARRRDGSEFPTEISLSPLQSEAGVAVIVAVRDITERKKAETERAALVREQAARAEAEAANRAKDDFLAVVSHELRTPLNAILGWAVLLQSNGSDRDLTTRALQAIERNARMQRQVIDDLLDVSAITAGKVSLDMQDIDLRAVVAAAEDSVRPIAEAKGIALEDEPPSTLPRVRGDARRLQQVYWNLLSNAIKFTPEGGRVRVCTTATPSWVEVRVTDSGIGIAPPFLPHVFDRFRQLDSSPARSYNGLGLGLAIVRELVELHGGRVKADSAGEGRGATFTVSLPVAAERRDRATRRPAAAASCVDQDETGRPAKGRLHGLRALVVDDDAETLRLVDAVLTGEGMDVTAAASAADALRELPGSRPDVLITDIAMPGQDGYGLLSAVREMGLSLPAIALTAFGRPQDRDHALAAGFSRHLTKPVLPDELVAVIVETTVRR